MSVFGSIMSSIFGHGRGSPAPAQPAPTQSRPAAPGGGNVGSASIGAPVGQPSGQPGAQQPAPHPAPSAQSAQPVNVEQILTQKAAQKGQPLNWQTSIVDLMKVLDIDSSLENRKALAHELGYTGDTGDSAAMNVWLHKKTMERLAENGGNAPASMKD